MVLSNNPKLSLPTDLPYKKRQRPFNPNTSLQQATVRYNEALRKQYNDVQFAKRYENGFISQNELMSVNTIDIGKTLEPEVFAEMSNLNPLPVIRQRKSRKIFISCGGTHSSSNGEILTSKHGHSHGCVSGSGGSIKGQYYSSIVSAPVSIPPLMSLSVNPGGETAGLTTTTVTNTTIVNKGCGDREQGQAAPSKHVQQTIDCNNTEMFPHLLATVGNNNSGAKSLPLSPGSHCTTGGILTSSQVGNTIIGISKYSSSTSSNLEAEALNEYEPNVDSAHDMIFGNVMGIQYGNYIHDQLWPTPQQSSSGGGINNVENCQNYSPNTTSSSTPTPHSQQSSLQQQNNIHQQQQIHTPLPTPPSTICGMSKSVGFNLVHNHHHPYHHACHHHFDYDTSSNTVSPLTNVGNLNGGGGVQYTSGAARRSTSVPRPRAMTGTRKETLKQAAIRCGIIKENQTVPAIPRRSHAHCLFPLQLSQADSDSTVAVVEILHPRTLIPTCSSELLEGESAYKPSCSLPLKPENSCSEGFSASTGAASPSFPSSSIKGSSSATGIEGMKPLKQIRSLADIRAIDNAGSSTSFRSQSDNNL